MSRVLAGLSIFLSLVLTESCASLRPSTILAEEVSADCLALDSEYTTWGGIAAGAGFLAGGGGIAAALYQDEPPRLAVGISSLVVGMASAVSSFVSNHYAAEYTQQCVKTSATSGQ